MLPFFKKTLVGASLLLGYASLWANVMPMPFLDTCMAPPSLGFANVTITYQDYNGHQRMATITAPDKQASAVQMGFSELTSFHFPIARLVPFADLPVGGLRQALENNISTAAVCTDWQGASRYFIFLNPAQNPMMATTLPCPDSGCSVTITPATSALSVNRSLMVSGMMTTKISTDLSEKAGWRYDHQPSHNLLLWSVFSLPLA